MTRLTRPVDRDAYHPHGLKGWMPGDGVDPCKIRPWDRTTGIIGRLTEIVLSLCEGRWPIPAGQGKALESLKTVLTQKGGLGEVTTEETSTNRTNLHAGDTQKTDG